MIDPGIRDWLANLIWREMPPHPVECSFAAADSILAELPKRILGLVMEEKFSEWLEDLIEPFLRAKYSSRPNAMEEAFQAVLTKLKQ